MLLVGFVGFVTASMIWQGNGPDVPYKVELELNKGWNIIAGTLPEDGILSDSEIQASDIKAIWYYHPQTREYIRVYPNPELSKLQQADEDVYLTSAMWVYSSKAGIIEYSTLEDYPLLENRQLYAGWNFVTITPDMFYEKNGQDVFSWNGIKGNCNFEKIYAWNPETQSWIPISPELESFDFNDFLGYGFIVKVLNDCKLSQPAENVAQPPQIPN